MMKERNIQSLFLSIRLDQIRQYLIARGWKERLTAIRREFEQTEENSQDTRTLILPLEESHPRFRSLVPNVIFSLAVASEREAIDIAEEISQIELPEPTPQTSSLQQPVATTPRNKPSRIAFYNSGPNPIVLRLSASSPLLEISPSESLLLSVKADDGIIQVKADRNLECALPPNCESQIFFGFPSQDFSFESAELLGDQIHLSSRNWDEESLTNFPGLRQQLTSAANRFLYEVEIPNGQAGTISTADLKSLAVLLVGLSRLLKASRESAADLFWIARRLTKPFGLTFPYSDDLPDQLWVTFRSDDPVAPRNSVALLKSTVTA